MTELSFSNISHVREHLRRLGAQPLHEQRILRLWAQAKPQDSGRRPLESFMPTALRQCICQRSRSHLASLLQLQSAHPAQDGSVRWLLALNDGQTVETVGLAA
jgi:23S rRNA (adenine2503-C2)-methyltransferase